jgi:GH24 family phage-related lysozyme (muramidase)
MMADFMTNISDQWSFTAPFEGVIPHIYKDSRGIITCGVGFALPTARHVFTIPWRNLHEADPIADYQHVRLSEPGREPAFYEAITHARLDHQFMWIHFNKQIALFERLLESWNLAAMPAPAKLAIVDMAYNLGVSGLDRYAMLRTACAECDWATAARECHRIGVQDIRNKATAALFEGLVAAVDGHHSSDGGAS